MRIATWNVNSLKARQEAVENWLERADAGHPAHAGDEARRRRRAGDGLRDGRLPARPPRRGPLERRRDRGPRRAGHRATSSPTSATARCATPAPGAGGRRRGRLRPVRRGADAGRDRRRPAFVCVYAPNGRVVGSPFYEGKLAWFERLGRWLDDERGRGAASTLVVGRRLQRRPGRRRRLGPGKPPTAARTSREPERAAVAALVDRGPRRTRYRARHDEPGRFTWWDYRAGHVPQELRDAHRPAARRPSRSRRGSSTPRSTARRARARRSRPTTRRCRSTSTSRASRSTRTGRGRLARIQGAQARDRRKSANRGGCADVAEDGTPCAASDPTERRLALPMTVLSARLRREIRLIDLEKRFGAVRAVDGVSLDVQPGRVLLAARAVRLRQDDDPADDRRLRAADGRADPAARARRHPRPARQAAGQHGLPELRAVPAPRRRRQHRVRAAAQEGRRSGDRPTRRRGARARPPGGLRATASRTSCRAASSSGSRSPGPSSTGPTCCSSTSRSAPSTSSSAGSSSSSSSASRPRSGSRSST